MSESSVDKTRRKLCLIFETYDFKYQYSLFFAEGTEAHYFLEEIARIKRSLRKKYNQPILLKINLSAKRGLHAYLTLYTEDPLDGFDLFMQLRFDGVVKSRRITEDKIESTLKAIKNQKPHNLKKYFGKSKINRYSMLGSRQKTRVAT